MADAAPSPKPEYVRYIAKNHYLAHALSSRTLRKGGAGIIARRTIQDQRDGILNDGSHNVRAGR